MNTKRVAASSLVAATLVAGLAGALGACSSGSPTEPTAAPSSSTAAPLGEEGQGAADAGAEAPGEGVAGAEEEVVAAALRAYQQALAAGDYVTACTLSTADAQARVLAEVVAGGGQAADCTQALTAVFGQAGARELAAESARTSVVEDVTIEGLNATVGWTSTSGGQSRTDRATLQFVDGQWRLASAA